MEPENWAEEFSAVISDAMASLAHERAATTNLYLDVRPYRTGHVLGPAFQDIVVDRPCILVFADDEPCANFAHDCRYRLYDAHSGSFHREVAARFPPYLHKIPGTFRAIHEPVRWLQNREPIRLPLSSNPRGGSAPYGRYAILYSSQTERRHLNDLEYCYQMLVNHHGFRTEDVFVLNFDGTLDAIEPGTPTHWPRDEDYATPYTMSVWGEGTRAAFVDVCELLIHKLTCNDLLLIHTNCHGDGILGESFLYQYGGMRYFAHEFCEDLRLLPSHESLLIMMQQCYSGGFIEHVMEAWNEGNIKAERFSIACASEERSYKTSDGLFDAFAQGWVAGHLGKDPFGGPLKQNPLNPFADPVDQDGDGTVEAKEAFQYAELVKAQLDQPAYDHGTNNALKPAESISLG